MIKTSITGGKKVKFGGGDSCETKENIDFIASLLQEKRIKATMDKIFPFDQLVQAHAYVESGRKKGNVVITGY